MSHLPIYLPSTSSPSAPEEVDWTSPSSWPFQVLEQSLLWRSKPSQSRLWWRRSNEVFWIRQLCTRMCAPSVAADGEALWMASLAESRVREIALLDDASDTTTPETCGSRPGGSSSSPERGSSGSRTSEASSARAKVGNLVRLESAETYTAWVSRLREDSSRRRTSASHMSASASSSSAWPTAVTQDAKNGRNSGSGRQSGSQHHDGDTLTDAITKWPTPAASEARQGYQRRPEGMASDQGQQSLSTIAADWSPLTENAPDAVAPPASSETATPASSNTPQPAAASGPSDLLAETTSPAADLVARPSAMWPTPDAEAVNDRENPDTFLARQAAEKAKGKNGNGMGRSLAIEAKIQSDALWPTASANDGERGADMVRRDNGKPQSSLKTAVAMFPTPATRDSKGANAKPFSERGGGRKGEQLANFTAHKWRTPGAADSERGTNGTWEPDPKAGEHSLRHQISQWQTPSVASATGGQANRGNDREEELLLAGQAREVSTLLPLTDSTSGETSSGPARTLNPLFVEWLMGWPMGWTIMCLGLELPAQAGWTDLECSGTALSQFKADGRSEIWRRPLLAGVPAQLSLFG